MEKIGIDVREFTMKPTGISGFLYNFLKTAQKMNLAKSNLEFILFGSQDTVIPKDLNYKFVNMREILTSYFDQIQLLKAIKEYKINVFFSPYPKIPIFAKTKKISSIFDLTYIIIESYKNKIKNKIYAKFLLDLYAKNADKIIALSENTKEDIADKLKVNKEKVVVVYPCVGENFRPAGEQKIDQIKEKYDICGKYILYVGNSRPHKNINRLIEAYDLVPENIKKEYSLVLAGVNKDELQIRNCGLRILSFVPDEDLPALYSGAELFLFPSLYEGFGLPPLEAMACGCSVISSNTSSMPEILGEACLYFNPDNSQEISLKMIELIQNHILKKEYIKKGLERVKMFSAEKTAEKLIEIFKNYE